MAGRWSGCRLTGRRIRTRRRSARQTLPVERMIRLHPGLHLQPIEQQGIHAHAAPGKIQLRGPHRQMRQMQPVGFALRGSQGQTGQVESRELCLQLGSISHQEAITATQVDASGGNHERDLMLDVLPQAMGLQAGDPEFAIRGQWLQGKVPAPFQVLVVARSAAEREPPAFGAGGEIVQLEGDRIDVQVDRIRTAQILEARGATVEAEGGDFDTRQGRALAGRRRRLRRLALIRWRPGFQGIEVQPAIACDLRVRKGSFDVDVLEHIRAMPQGGHFEVHEQPREPEQWRSVPIRQGEIPDVQLQQEGIDANLADPGIQTELVMNPLDQAIPEQMRCQQESTCGVQEDQEQRDRRNPESFLSEQPHHGAGPLHGYVVITASPR